MVNRFAIISTSTGNNAKAKKGSDKMSKLVKQVAEKFNGKILSDDTVKFSFGDDDYCLTDGTIYAEVEGQFMPGFKKVRGLLAVEHFVAERA